MPDLYDLWHWMSTLQTSPAFAVALPIVLARTLASIADWAEGYLAASASMSARQGHGQRVIPTGWTAFGDRGRSVEGS